jgi:hypothetical protein
MEALSSSELGKLASAFKNLEDYDYLIFDTSAGISKNVIAFCMNASEVILVITPEPTSLTDAYALMKILSLNGFKQKAKVVVNQCKHPKAAQVAFTKLKDTVRKFLGIQLLPLGTIVSDGRVIEAVAAQQPFIKLYPNTQAAKGLKVVAANLLEKSDASSSTLDSFWHRCVDILTVPLKMPAKKGEAPKQKETAIPEAAAAHQAPQSTAVPSAGGESGGAVGMNATASIQGLEMTHQLLKQLVENVSAVSQELAGIKTTLEKCVQTGFGAGPAGGRAEGTPPIIPLDFDAFMAEQEAGKENKEE